MGGGQSDRKGELMPEGSATALPADDILLVACACHGTGWQVSRSASWIPSRGYRLRSDCVGMLLVARRRGRVLLQQFNAGKGNG